MASSSLLAAASSSDYDTTALEYDVFLRMIDPMGCVKGHVEKKLRDAGIKAFVVDEEYWVVDDEDKPISVDRALERSRTLMLLITPEVLESPRLHKILMYGIGRSPDNLLIAYCGVSREQFLGRMKDMFPTYLNAAEVLSCAPSFGLPLDFWQKMTSHVANLGFSLLRDKSFHDLASHQVGLPLRMRKLLECLGLKCILSEDTIIVGIWGEGGIGKTTITKAIYDKIGGKFEGKSFLSNIKDVWEEDNGEFLLKNQLISDISETKTDEIDVVVLHEQIKQVLYGRRVLVVLDNVDSEFQLLEMFEIVKWSGKGSMIFVTTRNRDIFDASVDIYEMRRLNSKKSLKLFCLHAFKTFTPQNDFEDFSQQVIGCCEGIPFALEVFGSLLHNRTKKEWKKIVNNITESRYSPLQKKLKINCDLLTDIEKDLFFNIACFHVGQKKHYVTQLLKDSRLPVEMGLSVLIERKLVKVMEDKLYVHDLLKEIAREMIGLSKPKLKYSYDVFLSFRGEDTRKSFTSHLCAALKQAGTEVYMDEERMERGENISSSLLEAIESSRISIIIFSKNYASSSWCLQELEKIMECYKTIHQQVLPIFFDVQPFEVRKQQNAFGEAWERLIKRPSSSKMKKLTIKFKRILTEVANLSGTETELIDEVIETITKKLGDNRCLFVAHHPVGLESRMQDILQLLRSKSNDVIITGIWGMGGIGKTTIAKAIYNQVGQSFDQKCFLASVGEVWKQGNGQIYLQEQFLSEILKARRMVLPNVEEGKTLLEKVLCKKRVLLVLDNVNNEDQLKALCGSREWFGLGSRIIVTTRDERLLKILRVIHVYTVKELDDNESLELFSWHAFKQMTPEQDFIELSKSVVSYSGRLPLALEILGSYLFDRETSIWRSVLKKLQQIPNDQIHQKLKISYDGLTDNTEKDIFFDICCFLVGKDKSYAIEILNGCRLYAEVGIERLIELSLIKVGKKNKLEMHDLLRDMGREIIREQSLDEPENRTRLWDHDDVVDVLTNSTGTKAIKGLALDMSENDSIPFDAKAFKKMKKLYLLQLNHVQLTGDYNYLSTELRWLCWRGFTLENIPMNLCLQKIVAIDLKRSNNIIKVWEKYQLMEKMKILNLSHCHQLTRTPDFSKLPHLVKLVLKDCVHLSLIDPSIGDLEHIILINLKDCKSLKHLPRSIYKLKSLKTFNP